MQNSVSKVKSGVGLCDIAGDSCMVVFGQSPATSHATTTTTTPDSGVSYPNSTSLSADAETPLALRANTPAQVSASERERQLEVGMILTNFSNARAQVGRKEGGARCSLQAGTTRPPPVEWVPADQPVP
jgi:hypothetical protein